MLFEYNIPKQKAMDPYQAHRVVSGLFNDGKSLFCDCGEYLQVRSAQSAVSGYEPTMLEIPSLNDIIFTELRACCFVSSGGKKHFLKQGDWKARHDWLERKGLRNGFTALTITCQSKMMRVPKPGGAFSLDCTDFTACLKVTEAAKFAAALREGIGSKGRAFGFGMLIL